MPKSTRRRSAGFEDPLNLFSWAVTKLYSLWVSATYPFASKGGNLFIHPTAVMSRRVASAIKIGNSVIIRNNAWINTFDLSETEDETKIAIDDHCVINAQCVISAKNLIHLEPDVMVSACSLIMDHNHAYEDIGRSIQTQGLTPGGTIRIEQGCWIGHGAAIVCGQGELVLGRNSVVAANALVTRSFPPYSVIVGNPARLAKQFDTATGSWVGGTTRPSEPHRARVSGDRE
jgi:acetyltransferase-like isoleucine patch superfamily enzyme